MKNSNDKVCRKCVHYRVYYAEGYWFFYKTREGFCKKSRGIVNECDACGLWKKSAARGGGDGRDRHTHERLCGPANSLSSDGRNILAVREKRRPSPARERDKRAFSPQNRGVLTQRITALPVLENA